MKIKENAQKGYFFGQGYIDLINVFKDAWDYNKESADNLWDKDNDSWFYLNIVVALIIKILGPICFIVVSLIYFLILATVFIGTYIIYSFIWIIDKIYLIRKKIFTACPHCTSKSSIPHYICPKCGEVHKRLIPGPYGILKRKCLCGEKLGATFFSGRRKLVAVCPICSRGFKANEATPICIPVIGAPSVGKTCYIFSSVKGLIDDVAPQKMWEIEFANKKDEYEYEKFNRDFKSGIPPRKTADMEPVAFNFFLKNPNWNPEKLIYLYDVAGEVFEESDNIEIQQQYKYCHGIIFVIDPLSIPQVAERFKRNGDLDKYRVSVKDLNDTFDLLINSLERVYGIKSNKLIDIPCSIVINKTDAYDLENNIGEIALNNYKLNHNTKKLNDEQIYTEICKKFLVDNGAGNFVRNLESKFREYSIFTCSALGHAENKEFKPIRITNPLMWILKKADKDLNTK